MKNHILSVPIQFPVTSEMCKNLHDLNLVLQKLDPTLVQSITHNMGRKPKPLNLAALQVEYDMIVETLKKVDFDKAKAARLLNVDRRTIHNKLKKYRTAILQASEPTA